jgi:uncharacterized membrane protein YvbJ
VSYCTQCGQAASSTDRFCAQCGASIRDLERSQASVPSEVSKKQPSELKALVALASITLALGFGTLIFTGQLPLFFDIKAINQQRANDLVASVATQVANDTEHQFDIASKSGNKMDKCIAAQMATGAYLQAHDSDNYDRSISRRDLLCASAGVPVQ